MLVMSSKSFTSVHGRSRAARRIAARANVRPPATAASSSPRLGYVALVALTAAVYLSVWHGGRLWDDDGHLTSAALQPLSGLWRVWFVSGATQQYYPVVHSAFWVLHRLFGDDTLGYHLINIALHATGAWLFVRLLQRLAVPGAWLAGVIFVLHPVEVESVAWMSELKKAARRADLGADPPI